MIQTFTFVPADKESNIVIIVWRFDYIDVLKHELINTKAYIPVNTSVHAIVSDHVNNEGYSYKK